MARATAALIEDRRAARWTPAALGPEAVGRALGAREAAHSARRRPELAASPTSSATGTDDQRTERRRAAGTSSSGGTDGSDRTRASRRPDAARTTLDARRRPTCATLQHPTAGGRASWRPTSRWRPRTCCCGEFLGIRTAQRDTERPSGSGRSSAPTAPGPPSTAGPATCRPRSRPTPRCGWPATTRRAAHMRRPRTFVPTRRHGAQPGVHPDLVGAVRAVVVGRAAGPAAGGDAAAAVVPAEHLRLRLLGPPDDRAADDRRPPTGRCRPLPFTLDELRTGGARPPRRRRGRRAGASSCSTACCTATSAAHCGRLRAAGDAPGRRVDPRPPGGRRLVGRHPAAVGLLAARAAPARLSRSTTR